MDDLGKRNPGEAGGWRGKPWKGSLHGLSCGGSRMADNACTQCSHFQAMLCRRADGEEDDMGEWDQEKLEAVVAQKHGAEKGNQVNKATDIICKFFLDAVEGKQYGW